MKKQVPIEKTDQAVLWKPKRIKGLELFKARFKTFVFDKHFHEFYVISVVEHGILSFHHCRGFYKVSPMEVLSLNPCEVHDGLPTDDKSYFLWSAYVDPELVREVLCIPGGSKELPVFRGPIIVDRQLGRKALFAFHSLEKGEDILREQSLFADLIIDLFLKYSSSSVKCGDLSVYKKEVETAVDYMRSYAACDISLDEIASQVNLSRFHFLRVFKGAMGISPHMYLKQYRVELARMKIERGFSLSESAVSTGFSDQSHLTRSFKSAYGLTPGQYRKAISI